MKQPPRPAHVLACDPLELGWAAGLFEGEGSISVRTRSQGGRQGYGPYVSLKLGMTDRDVVEHFEAVVGCGSIFEVARKPPRKRFYVWNVASAPEALALLEAFEPLFGARRRARAREGIAAIRAGREMVCQSPACTNGFLAYSTQQRYCSVRCYTNRKRDDEAARIRVRRNGHVTGQLALEALR